MHYSLEATKQSVFAFGIIIPQHCRRKKALMCFSLALLESALSVCIIPPSIICCSGCWVLVICSNLYILGEIFCHLTNWTFYLIYMTAIFITQDLNVSGRLFPDLSIIYRFVPTIPQISIFVCIFSLCIQRLLHFCLFQVTSCFKLLL